MHQFHAERRAVLAAVAHDPTHAQQATQQAQQQQHDAWAAALAAIVAAAALSGWLSLQQAAQAAGVVFASGTLAGSPADAWASANQDGMADGVQAHTGRMLTNLIADALLLGNGGAALATAIAGLYDQWTGATGQGDYAGQLAGDLTVLGWGMGQQWGIAQLLADGQWSAQKTWNTMGDNRVRPTHDDVDGVTLDASDSFSVGGDALDYPGMPGGSDAETAGCRCWLTWQLLNNTTGATQDSAAPDGED